MPVRFRDRAGPAALCHRTPAASPARPRNCPAITRRRCRRPSSTRPGPLPAPQRSPASTGRGPTGRRSRRAVPARRQPRAAASARRVPIRSRSNCANRTRMFASSRPESVVRSMVSAIYATSCGWPRPLHQVREVQQRPREPVKLRGHEHVDGWSARDRPDRRPELIPLERGDRAGHVDVHRPPDDYPALPPSRTPRSAPAASLMLALSSVSRDSRSTPRTRLHHRPCLPAPPPPPSLTCPYGESSQFGDRGDRPHHPLPPRGDLPVQSRTETRRHHRANKYEAGWSSSPTPAPIRWPSPTTAPTPPTRRSHDF